MLLDYNTWVVVLGTGFLGLASGVIGTFAVLRRRALIGDALSHAALPGICLAFLITGERSFPVLLTGAFFSGLLGVWVVSFLRRHTRTKEDAALGIVLSVFFGVGIALSRIAQNTSVEGSKAGLDSFIFGKTAGMLSQDVYALLALVVALLLVVAVFYKEFKLVSFDPEFATVQGWPTTLLDLSLMALLAVTVVVGLPAVGVALMAALLVLPGAAARFWADRLGPTLLVAGLLGLAAGVGGTLLGAFGPALLPWAFERDPPAGPVIVLTGTVLFLLSLFFAPKRGVLARALEHLQLRREVAFQNLLRAIYEIGEARLPTPTASGGTLQEGAEIQFSVAELLPRRSWSTRRLRRVLARATRARFVCPLSSEAYQMTGLGLDRAASVVRAHRLWELFLLEEAHVAQQSVDRDADLIEHVLPPALIRRLEETLQRSGRLPLRGTVPPSPHEIAREHP